MKHRIHPIPLPPDALLARYATSGAYTDCYAIELSRRIALAEYVETFYTGGIFRIERWLLRWLMSRPSTDVQARQVAQGEVEEFAAWRVEDRLDDQLLMCDVHGRTRSWFMVSPTGDGAGTRLYFGSAVVPLRGRAGEPPRMGGGFRALLGFHKLYSRVLLSAAGRRLAADVRLPSRNFDDKLSKYLAYSAASGCLVVLFAFRTSNPFGSWRVPAFIVGAVVAAVSFGVLMWRSRDWK